MQIAWLLHLEVPSNAQSRAAATLLQPVMKQAATYFHELRSEKGVRVGHIDMQSNAELQRVLCDDGVCQPLVLYKAGRTLSYRGSG